jgi:hypothetical protein
VVDELIDPDAIHHSFVVLSGRWRAAFYTLRRGRSIQALVDSHPVDFLCR